MGAGSSAAGKWPSGFDPVPNPSAARDVHPPAALYFDGATQGFLLDASGQYVGIDPVDQAVALSLILRLGTVGPVPTIGAGFRSIKRITSRTAAEVTDMARAALRSRVEAQDIAIKAIQVETKGKPAGAVLVAVSYVNLRKHPPVPSTLRFNLNNG